MLDYFHAFCIISIERKSHKTRNQNAQHTYYCFSEFCHIDSLLTDTYSATTLKNNKKAQTKPFADFICAYRNN